MGRLILAVVLSAALGLAIGVQGCSEKPAPAEPAAGGSETKPAEGSKEKPAEGSEAKPAEEPEAKPAEGSESK